MDLHKAKRGVRSGTITAKMWLDGHPYTIRIRIRIRDRRRRTATYGQRPWAVSGQVCSNLPHKSATGRCRIGTAFVHWRGFVT